ncbi:MAG: baseplate J/gp47 family protein [Microcoleus sp.]
MAANPYFLSADEVVDQIISYLPPSWQANFTGKVLKRLIVAVAYAIEGLYALSAQLLRLAIPITSEGRFLQAWARSIGMTPYSGVRATGVATFERYRVGEEITVPIGTRIQSAAGIRFETTQSGVIGATETQTTVPIVALNSGTSGNIGVDGVNIMVSQVVGVDRVFNAIATQNGLDSESDDSLRNRIGLHLAMLHRATIPAIEGAINQESYPEVRSFVTYRNAGTPGYIRAIMADAGGGDSFRPEWSLSSTTNLYTASCTLDTVNGLTASGWPCRRFGEYGRAEDGREQWLESASIVDCAAGPWRFYYDRNLRRLYASTDGTDLSTIPCTIYAGVLWRALVDLENNWVANGVGIDIIVPFVTKSGVRLTYELEVGYNAVDVEAALRSAVVNYIAGMTIGQDFELEGIFPALASVAGARGVLITEPTANVVIAGDAIFRLAGSVLVARRLS